MPRYQAAQMAPWLQSKKEYTHHPVLRDDNEYMSLIGMMMMSLPCVDDKGKKHIKNNVDENKNDHPDSHPHPAKKYFRSHQDKWYAMQGCIDPPFQWWLISTILRRRWVRATGYRHVSLIEDLDTKWLTMCDLRRKCTPVDNGCNNAMSPRWISCVTEKTLLTYL